MSELRRSYSPSYSSDEMEWTATRKNFKRKAGGGSSKKINNDGRISDPEEGEIPSDALEDDEDDGLDENLYGGDEDKQRLLKMSEKEREEELYRRAERRDAMKIRRDVKRRLKEQKEKEKNERANLVVSPSSKHTNESSTKISKKSSAYANIYSSDSDQGSSSSVESIKSGSRSRKFALDKKKETVANRLQELADLRKKSKNKRISNFSDSEEETKRTRSLQRDFKRRVYSSSSSDSDSSRSRKDKLSSRKQPSSSSSSRSSSARSSASSDNDRGRSRSPVEEYISNLEQLSKLRLSRYKLEKWVHMPFFDELVKGCFVRINIGLSHGVPVYRCGEIVDVVEMPKTYDLGKTRTNKGIVLRIGKDQHTFRLAIISNAEFQQSEFDSWKRHTTEASIRPPTTAFVAKKSADIHKALVTPISDERIVEQIIQSKRRFQKAPTNFALRKAELLKHREQADENGESENVRRLDLELDELETQAERIERRRTMGFKSINSINQRNRILSVKQAEDAIIREAVEDIPREDDPFTRIQSKPVIVTKSYLERLRKQKIENSAKADENAKDAVEKQPEKANPVDAALKDSPSSFNLPAPPEESLHAIHDFEIDINVQVNSNHDDERFASGMHQSVSTPTVMPLDGSPLNGSSKSNLEKPNRRFLNLQEYKRRRGLI